MVDLTERTSTKKKQRAFHMTDATHDRLARAAKLSGGTMSTVLDRLIWEDLHLPDDPLPDVVGLPGQPATPPPTGRAAVIAERAEKPTRVGEPLDPETQARLAKSAERVRKSGRFATKLDGSDQRERDSDAGYESGTFGGARPAGNDFDL